MIPNYNPFKGGVLPVIVLLLVTGSLALAFIDKDSRASFADLAKVGVGGYIGLMMPREKQKSSQ